MLETWIDHTDKYLFDAEYEIIVVFKENVSYVSLTICVVSEEWESEVLLNVELVQSERMSMPKSERATQNLQFSIVFETFCIQIFLIHFPKYFYNFKLQQPTQIF